MVWTEILEQWIFSSDFQLWLIKLVSWFQQESYGDEFANQVASSPPYFCESPPVRAANPLIQDARFGDEKHAAIVIPAMSSPSGLPSPRKGGGGCVRMSFGLKPAAVRVEGFDCLNRDHRQNSSIPAVA